MNNSLNTVGTVTDTLTLTLPSKFDLSGIYCKDVDLTIGSTATSIAGYFSNRATSKNCPGSATSWGLFIDPTATTITFYTPTSARTWVATGTQVVIKIGSNASFQDTGTAWITNPARPGVYTISVGGTFGGSGNIPVSINSGQTVQATVAENLSFTVSGSGSSATYAETDTAGTTNNFICDGVTGSGTLRNDNTMQQGGTPGAAHSYGPNTGTKGIVASFISPPGDPNLVNWNSGNWVMRLNDTGGGGIGSLTWTGTCIFRVDSAGTTNLATVGSLTGQSIDMTTTGLKTMTISGSSQTANVTDRIYVEIVFSATVNKTAALALDQNIDTPLMIPACTADDGATVNAIATTATTVDFGTFSQANAFYQGCQDLNVSTNAMGGYSLTVQESSAMQTPDGLYSIPDTTCDAGNCSVVSRGIVIWPHLSQTNAPRERAIMALKLLPETQ
ncbi:MAG TPA: hypothetical protein VEV41_18280 [Terriglobales bacterium]|nr:hypothetical protein [Terriglobales bacterium]